MERLIGYFATCLLLIAGALLLIFSEGRVLLIVAGFYLIGYGVLRGVHALRAARRDRASARG